MKVIVFDIGGTLMEYKNMPLSCWISTRTVSVMFVVSFV